ncbi:uncharacterized protein LOC105217338 [Zeugodacus cucurbitae]|uniref:uncharacterized protein LOC105217338 n=1 Tax=Zeugodacus cucurbitae TaxID=28588 RepID=UPI0005969007|nr:uncharacterized protein LOC105217338 [Zeugodacus cucurbitae]
MNFLTLSATLMLFAACVTAASLNVVSEDNTPSAPLPINGAAVDEVLVESSLRIKPKANLRGQARRVRSIPFEMPLNSASLLEHVRVKRAPQSGQSQATAAADANSHYFGPQGSGSSAANAGSQAFNTFSQLGSFGASSAGTLTQASQSGIFGSQNSGAASMSQVYKLPNGQVINFASTNSFANGPKGNQANSRGSAVSVSQ